MTQYLLSPPEWTTLPLIFAGLLLIFWDSRRIGNARGPKGATVALYVPTDQREPHPIKRSTQKSRSEKDRIFVGESITPDYLCALFKEHASIQADKLVEAYLGKWMRVSGNLRDVLGAGTDTALVSLQTENKRPEIYLFFREKKWVDRVSIIRRGDAISAIGTIKEVGSIGLQLDDCEPDDES